MYRCNCLMSTQFQAGTQHPSSLVLKKLSFLKKILKHQDSLELLGSLGKAKELSIDSINDAVEFVKTVMYSGRKDESLVDTRARLYKAMKAKSSQPLPPDPDSMHQAILRVHYQLYHWLRLAQKSIPSRDAGELVGQGASRKVTALVSEGKPNNRGSGCIPWKLFGATPFRLA